MIPSASHRPGEREAVEAELPAVLYERLIGFHPVVRDPLVPFLHRDEQFATGQMGTGAAVRSGTERYVTIRLSIDDHTVGVLDRSAVAGRGPHRHEDHLALLHRA